MKTLKLIFYTAALLLFTGKTIYAQGNEQGTAKAPAQSSVTGSLPSEKPGAFHPVAQPAVKRNITPLAPAKEIHSGSGNAHDHTPKPAQPGEARYVKPNPSTK